MTVLCSEKGWIRAVKGHNLALGDIKYKEGDGPRFAVAAETTDRLLIFATDGRFYTLGVDKLPGGRGHGEPLRLMIDLDAERGRGGDVPLRAGRRSCWWRRATGAASSCRRTRCWPRRATASR